jgi:hypothetical protein
LREGAGGGAEPDGEADEDPPATWGSDGGDRDQRIRSGRGKDLTGTGRILGLGGSDWDWDWEDLTGVGDAGSSRGRI